MGKKKKGGCLAAVMAALLAMAVMATPAMAALTYQSAPTNIGSGSRFATYIVATGNDTTDPINGRIIDNRDGSLQSISAQLTTTASSGTSPTANLILQGSNDCTNFYGIMSADASPVAVSTGAQSISSAVTIGLDSAQELRAAGGFPACVRVQLDLGGTTPGITGTVSVFATRRVAN